MLGQALMAASLTVPSDRLVHSFHSYFLLPGRHQEIDYSVENLRDGGSFSTRRVHARQQNEVIFDLSASYQTQEGILDKQEPMLRVPGPEGIASEMDYRKSLGERLPPQLRGRSVLPIGIEYRPVEPFDWLEAKASIWFRAAGAVPDSPALHRALLAYACDHGPLLTATQPFGLSVLRGEIRIASIDHAMWFRRAFRVDGWLLHQVDSPTVQGSRVLCRGAIYSDDGRLVASTMQEGFMRVVSR